MLRVVSWVWVGALGAPALASAAPQFGVGWCAERLPQPSTSGGGLGVLPTVLEAADFNGDGRLDLLFNGDAGVLRLALAAPGSGFAPPRTVDAIGNGSMLASADIDGDGNRDIAMVMSGAGQVRLYLGDGKGDFAFLSVYSMSSGASPSPSDIGLEDVDGDGAPDLVAVDTSTRELAVRFNLGGGVFGPAGFTALGGYPGQFELGDVDGDGDVDLAAHGAGQSSKIGVMLGDGAGNFGAPLVTAISAYPFVLRDIDLDGKLDLSVATGFQGAGGLRVFLGDGSGAFALASSNPIGAELRRLALGDFDGDGACDAAVAEQSGATWLLQGLGAGTFAPPRRISMPGTFGAMTAADIDGDGYDDLATLGIASAGVWFGSPIHTLALPVEFTLAGPASALEAADFDADAHVDVLVGRAQLGQGVLELLRGDSSGGLTAGASVSLAAAPEFLRLSDFDGDGVLDVLCASRSGARLEWVRGAAGGPFAPSVTLESAGAYTALATSDVDGDGIDDALALVEGQNTLHVLLGGQPSPPNATLVALPASPIDLACGDVDGDGVDDVLVALDDGSFAWLRGTPAGLTAAVVTPSTRTLRAVDVADLDGDGFADVVLGTLEAGLVAHFGGPTGVGPANAMGPLRDVARVRIGDLDSRGRPDVVFRVGIGERDMVGARLGGTAGFSESAYYSFAEGGGAVAFGDLDGDGWAEAIAAEPNQALLRISVRRKGPRFESYCPAGVSSAGCVARIWGEGEPSLNIGAGLRLHARELDSQRTTLFFLSSSRPTIQPWGSGGTSLLCLAPPYVRAGLRLSSGAPGGCDGEVDFDATALVANAGWNPGALVFAQMWIRDPLAPNASQLSNALAFELAP